MSRQEKIEDLKYVWVREMNAYDTYIDKSIWSQIIRGLEKEIKELTSLKIIKELYEKGFKNPSAITSILFTKDVASHSKFTEMRKVVKKEIQRINSKNNE